MMMVKRPLPIPYHDASSIHYGIGGSLVITSFATIPISGMSCAPDLSLYPQRLRNLLGNREEDDDGGHWGVSISLVTTCYQPFIEANPVVP